MAIERNAVFLWNNDAADNAVLTASSEEEGFPVSNLQTTLRSRVWRSEDGLATIDVDFGQNVIVSSMGLVEHDLDWGATVKFEGYLPADGASESTLDAGGAVNKGSGLGLTGLPCTAHGLAEGDLIYISGSVNYNGLRTVQAGTTANEIVIDAEYSAESFSGDEVWIPVALRFEQTDDAWVPLWLWGEGGWGEGGWGGAPPADWLEKMPKPARAFLFPSYTGVRFARVTIDNGSTPFHLGRLFLCRHFEPENNVSYGWECWPEDTSRVEHTEGGVPWTDIKPRRYSAQARLDHLTSREVLGGEFLRFCYDVGTRRDFIFQLFSDGTRKQIFTCFYGRFERTPVPSNPDYLGGDLRFTARVSIIESL